jgi:hypothetical protein
LSRIIGLLLLLPFAYFAALLAASEWGGEVVELETYDANDTMFTTSLWIVDAYGDTWLRAGDPDAAWLQRLRMNPEVNVTRDGLRQGYRAVVIDDFARRLNEAMREKYGIADRIVSTLHDPDEVVAIRLEER